VKVTLIVFPYHREATFVGRKVVRRTDGGSMQPLVQDMIFSLCIDRGSMQMVEHQMFILLKEKKQLSPKRNNYESPIHGI
jgi:hypothetical protein